MVVPPGPPPPHFGPAIPDGDVKATFTEVDELRDEVFDYSSDLGRWALFWGSLGLVLSLLLHGPVFFIAEAVVCGAAFFAWLLSRRRTAAGMHQSVNLAWVGLLLGILALGLAFAGLIGHPLLGLGWSWQAH
jgi:hypothetical protein